MNYNEDGSFKYKVGDILVLKDEFGMDLVQITELFVEKGLIRLYLIKNLDNEVSDYGYYFHDNMEHANLRLPTDEELLYMI